MAVVLVPEAVARLAGSGASGGCRCGSRGVTAGARTGSCGRGVTAGARTGSCGRGRGVSGGGCRCGSRGVTAGAGGCRRAGCPPWRSQVAVVLVPEAVTRLAGGSASSGFALGESTSRTPQAASSGKCAHHGQGQRPRDYAVGH